jgi:hypothetical protein
MPINDETESQQEKENGNKGHTIADILSCPPFKLIEPTFLSHACPMLAHPSKKVHAGKHWCIGLRAMRMQKNSDKCLQNKC